ncbi:MAG TPA: hypothetical protein VGS20_06570 [Candidatus Acidoferrales bacterium]|nr:hypothetical protein [Candidatus Acidoferrales bacterium]
MAVLAALAGCGTAGGSGSSGPPPPPAVTVSVAPPGASLFFGQQQSFSASVTGTSNTAVSWSVDGVAGGNSVFGTITAQGLYTAPNVLPSTSTVTITAISQAQPSATGTATVTLESDVQVTISPTTASLPAGGTQTFTAKVSGTGSPATAVTWSLTGSACPSACGSLTASGNTATYTAPATVAGTISASVVATSVADPSKSATASVTVKGACSPPVSVSPATASVALGGQQAFTATVCFSANQAVAWSITGSGCTGGSCGSVASTGPSAATYTAPTSPPPANPVTLVATSAADSTQFAAASITITSAGCSPPISVSPTAATVSLGAQQPFTAAVCFTANQQVNWSIAGAGCAGANCGSVSSTGANTAVYTAPASLPPSNPISLVATSAVDSTQSAAASITVTSGVHVSLAPAASELAVNHRESLAATVAGSSNQAVSWAVAGVANGNAAVGRICAPGSNPCSPPAGAQAGPVDYLAPAAVPSPATATVTATAAADPSSSASGAVTVLGHLVIAVFPANSVVAPSGTVEFAATVTGSANTGVTWAIACAASNCGSITAAGVYTAAATAASPNVFTITATSQDDPTQSASATVALNTAVSIQALAPASITAGAAAGFALAVTGHLFAPTSPGPGTTILANNAPRTTTCSGSTQCTITIAPADVAAAGLLALQAKNPDGSLSNPVLLVIVPADAGTAIIALSASQPMAGGEDVLAVEPTTAGAGAPPVSLLFLGLLDTATNTCNVNLSPIALARPASGTASFTICAGGQGLDSTFQFSIVGSQSTGVTLSGVQAFAGSLIQITVTVSSAAAPGLRTLLAADSNNDRAVASGAIDVQ